MLNSEFEKKMKQELDDVSFEPSDAVWERVEATLPEKNKRRWILFLLPLVLVSSLLLTWKLINPAATKEGTSKQQNIKSAEALPAKKNAVRKKPDVEKFAAASAVDSKLEINYEKALSIIEITGNGDGSTKSVKTNKRTTPSQKSVKDGLSNSGRMAATINSPAPEAENTYAAVTPPNIYNPSQTAEDQIQITRSDTIPNEVVNNSTSKIEESEVAIKKSDTLIQPTSNKKAKEDLSKWQLGFTVGGGIANLTSGFFNSEKMYADVFSSGSSTGIPPPAATGSREKTSASFAFTTGITLEKMINRKFTLHTGIHYAYHSSNQAVGQRIDSSGIFITNSGNAFVSSYYRNGGGQKYTNKLHFINLPVIFQFRPSQRWPLFIEGGMQASVLVGSNVLQYNVIRNVYFEDARSLNKLMLGMQAGIGGQWQSFKLGYRFNHSLGAFTNENPSRYVVSSIIYLQLPIKKY